MMNSQGAMLIYFLTFVVVLFLLFGQKGIWDKIEI